MFSSRDDLDSFLLKLLNGVLTRFGGNQIFLFGPDGDPFWPARSPVQQSEIDLLSLAIDHLEGVERARPRPFLTHDPLGRFVAVGLGLAVPLYVVVLDDGPDPLVAERRIARVRDEIAPELERIPAHFLRAANAAH